MKNIALSISLFLSFLLAACSPLPGPQKIEPVNIYLLDWTPQKLCQERNSSSSAPSLLVLPMRSSPGFDSADMVYEIKPHQLDHFAYHRWADTPANMLYPLLIQAFEKDCNFKTVLSASSQAHADMLLETELLCLKQIFKDNESEVQLKIRATLFDLNKDKVKEQKIFFISEPTQSPDPYSGVVAANRAVVLFLHELVEFIKASLK